MSPPPSARPSRLLAILTCMDCRIDPLAVAGLGLGEAHVIRNAGAVVSADVRRSLALSQRALGTNEVWIIAHTDCGVLGLDDQALLAEIESEVGDEPDWRPGGFESLEQHVRDGIERIRVDPVLDSARVRGFVCDVESGELDEIE